jgi:poly(3-hydroxybutyrate) depolymerase
MLTSGRRSMRTATVLFACLVAVLTAAPASAKDASRLLRDYFRARAEDDRAAAWKAIEECPPLELRDVPKLATEALRHLEKAGRRVPPRGRNEWFDERQREEMRKQFDTDGEKGEYEGLFFSSGGRKKGLVLALHGGGKGSGDAGSAKSAFSGPIGSIGMSGLFPQVLKKTEYGWTLPEATERWVIELITRARVSWHIDPNRVHVTGHSMGGYGTWTYLSAHADLFAGGAAFAGGPTVLWEPGRVGEKAYGVAPGYLPNLRNVPIFVYQSLDDQNVRPAANQAAIAGLRELRAKDPKGYEFRYEEVDKRGHAFPKGGPVPGLRWMASHVRNPRPERVVWQPTRAWKKTFYWLRWEDPWLDALVTATRDPERNAIDIELDRPRGGGTRQLEERIRGLSVYLDDRVLDLSREVVITVGGEERYRGRPEVRLATLVRSAEEREDPEYVFAAEARLGAAAKGD